MENYYRYEHRVFTRATLIAVHLDDFSVLMSKCPRTLQKSPSCLINDILEMIKISFTNYWLCNHK